MAGIYYESFDFAIFIISSALANIKAVTYFWIHTPSIYLVVDIAVTTAVTEL